MLNRVKGIKTSNKNPTGIILKPVKGVSDFLCLNNKGKIMKLYFKEWAKVQLLKEKKLTASVM